MEINRHRIHVHGHIRIFLLIKASPQPQIYHSNALKFPILVYVLISLEKYHLLFSYECAVLQVLNR